MLVRTGDPRNKHIRGPRKQKKKPVEMIYDHLSREDAMKMYNLVHVNEKWQNNMEKTIEPTMKRNTSIWRAAFEKGLDKLNHKLYALVEQVKQSDRKADELNVDFHRKNGFMHNKFYTDFNAMTKESQRRNAGFLRDAQVNKFMNDLNTLAKENNNRNVGFHCTKKSHKENLASAIFSIGAENQKRNTSFFNKRQDSDWERMKKMNSKRSSFFTTKKSSTNFDTVLEMNDKRNQLFRSKRPESKLVHEMNLSDMRSASYVTRKPLSKLEEVAKWNANRNALFNLRL